MDGQAKFGCDLVTFYKQPMLVVQAARFGVLIPPITEVAEDAEPALACVETLLTGQSRWIAYCPDCRAKGISAAEYVWFETQLFWCMVCLNRGIGSCWRPLVAPSNRTEIERLLLARPNPLTRNWHPEEAVSDLLVDNVMLFGGGG